MSRKPTHQEAAEVAKFLAEAMGSGVYRDIRTSGNYTPEYNEAACKEKLMVQELYLTLQRFFPPGLNWRGACTPHCR